MKTIKKLGICMDHANAHLIKFSDEEKPTATISLDFDNQDKNAYYKKLAVAINDFNELVLFGSTNAKGERSSAAAGKLLLETLEGKK